MSNKVIYVVKLCLEIRILWERRVFLFKVDESPGYLAYLVYKAYDEAGSEMIKDLGLNNNQWFIIDQLYYHEGKNQVELSEICHRDPSAFLKTIDVMEKKGLVIREIDSKDRRVKRVYLTAKAKELREKILPVAEADKAKALDGFTIEEVNIFMDMCKRILHNVEQNEQNS